MMAFCREHERALAIQKERLQLQDTKRYHQSLQHRRYLRLFEDFMSSLGTLLVLAAAFFVCGFMSAQLYQNITLR